MTLPDNSLNVYNGAQVIPLNGTTIITATVTLSGLSAPYTGTPVSVEATTVPAGLAVSITYAGSATPPTAAGSYRGRRYRHYDRLHRFGYRNAGDRKSHTSRHLGHHHSLWHTALGYPARCHRFSARSVRLYSRQGHRSARWLRHVVVTSLPVH